MPDVKLVLERSIFKKKKKLKYYDVPIHLARELDTPYLVHVQSCIGLDGWAAPSTQVPACRARHLSAPASPHGTRLRTVCPEHHNTTQ